MPAAARRRLAHRAATVGVLLALAAGLAACSGSDAKTAAEKKNERTQVSLGTPATTEIDRPPPSTAGTTAKVPATTGRPSPGEAAARLYDTWKAGDRPSAAEVATPTAVDGMWATAPGDYTLYTTCDSGEFGTSTCLYRGNPRSLGTIDFNMEKRGALWVVIDARYTPA